VNQIDLAKNAIEVLQSKWGKKGGWSGAEAWQRCVIADALITYTLQSNDYTYIDVIESAVQNRSGLSGNDDDMWSSIAALKAFYLTGDTSYWDSFVMYEYGQIATKYWDNTCEGGVWWDYDKTYKNAITNELWLTFVMLMYAATGNQAYLDWGNKTWDWFRNSGMINTHNLINDGLNPSNCKNNGEKTWTYNQGVILSGLANLHQFGSADPSYEAQGSAIAEAVRSPSGILQEASDPMSLTAESFKGIYMQNLGYFLSVFSSSSSYDDLLAFMNLNASHVQQNATEAGTGEISAYWNGPPSKLDAVAQGAGIQLYTGTYAAAAPGHPQWSYVRIVPGVGTSSTPSATSFNGNLYAAWKGIDTDEGIYFASMDSQNNWTGQSRIAGVGTATGVALSTFNNHLYALWKGVRSDQGIYYASMDSSKHWTGQKKITGVGTDCIPSVAVFNGKLYVAWKGVGSDSGIYFASMDSQNNWTAQRHIAGVGTATGVSLSTFNNRLYALWKGVGSDQGIYYASMDSAENWTAQEKIANVGTDGIPSLSAYDGKLYAAWKGIGLDNHIWYCTRASGSAPWSTQTRFVMPGVTRRAPSLATFNNRLYNIYAGAQKDWNNISFSCFPALTPRGF
jgi:hypothetical protein